MARKDFIVVRLDADTKEKFEDIAKVEKRYPSELVRLMIEARVKKDRKSQNNRAVSR